jgi:glycosyltransferase involved in cell wall biosynthesis
MLRVAAFTGGRNVPSARFRVRQHIPHLIGHGVEMVEFAAPFGSYPPRTRWLRLPWAATTLAARLPGIMKGRGFDVTLLQRELLSTFMTLEPLTKKPRVLDVDDAIWSYRGGGFVQEIAKRCDLVICGNQFLAEHLRQWNSTVTVIPTAVDTRLFAPGGADQGTPSIIGWSGTSGGLRYLYGIEEALYSVLKNLPEARLRVVSDTRPNFARIPPERVEFVAWSPKTEVEMIRSMTVGIMPLEDSVWERGKCSYKMLTYMACGIPVVVSPIGMNAEVLNHGRVGLGARSLREWEEALFFLLTNRMERLAMGKMARQIVLRKYSINVLSPLLAKSLAGVVTDG